ncbi:tyrosine recombinase XerC [Ornithinibacillus halophilus]|uniref:Tyrosine recombinase XerC n=1 Tax=Ornithinibacillus halophilus TaxID=930117 RepID=A0A1M5C9C8_9BACI|nr:tyrosine recombinase XerC [Ornithinibacillus halophilus]SHF51321.1 tyrosine recombinase XerC subunit [Ornithinibacillus halophilus]
MKTFSKELNSFITYLKIEKNASPYTIEYYKNDLEKLFSFLNTEGIASLNDVDHKVIRVFLTFLYEQQLSRRTVSRNISTLRSFFSFLEREEIIDTNPVNHISLPKTEKNIPGFFYTEELEKLFEANDTSTPLGQRNQAILELLYATGIRVSELQQLQLDDVDFSIGTILVHGKGRKDRYVPFGKFAENALKKYIYEGREKLVTLAKTPSSTVFLNSRGNPLTTRGIRLILNKMVERAALTIHIHPHKLRHTFATHMLNEGADLRTVQELLGHEKLSSTQIYTHVTKDHLRNIYMNSHPRARK